MMTQQGPEQFHSVISMHGARWKPPRATGGQEVTLLDIFSMQSLLTVQLGDSGVTIMGRPTTHTHTQSASPHKGHHSRAWGQQHVKAQCCGFFLVVNFLCVAQTQCLRTDPK